MFNRGGVIPYILENDTKIYLFAIDSDYQNLIDFGGHVEESIDKDIYDTILREVSEETYNCLNNCLNISRQQLSEGEHVEEGKNLEIILQIKPDITAHKLSHKLRQTLSKHPEGESCSVVWVSEDKLRIICSMEEDTASHFMYPVVYRALKLYFS